MKSYTITAFSLGAFVVSFLFTGTALGGEGLYFDVYENSANEVDEVSYIRDSGSCHDSCCDCGSACACASVCGPIWSVRANALFFDLSTPNNAVLATSGGAPVLNASEFDFDVQAGWEISLIRNLNPNWGFEMRYFSVDAWSATRAPIATGAGFIRYSTPRLFGAGTIGGTYESELYNVELNARRRVSDKLDLLMGFRYVALNDGGITIGTELGGVPWSHCAETENDLYGFQIGADAELLSRGRLELEGIAKAGIYGNAANNSLSATLNGLPPSIASDSASHTAFVGELGLTGVVQVRENVFVRAGYQLIWIDGVAQASDQFATSDPIGGTSALDFSGSPFYQGAFVGVEILR